MDGVFFVWFAVGEWDDVVAGKGGGGVVFGGEEVFYIDVDFDGHEFGELYVVHEEGGGGAVNGKDDGGVFVCVGVGGERADVGLCVEAEC